LLLLTGRPEDPGWRTTWANIDHLVLPLACWMAFFMGRRRWDGVAEFDRLWLQFRDRFGLFWSQRIRDQFNRAAANAGWPVLLRWRGLRKTVRQAVLPADLQNVIVETLQEMQKRFGPAVDR